MRCLSLISCLLLLSGCHTLHNSLQKNQEDINCLEKCRPVFTTALYKGKVDVTGKHLSGLLVIKKMPDSSTRMLFSSEMGFTFFDFEFDKTVGFKVYSIIRQMNKKPVIKTLRKDFELVLMQYVRQEDMLVRGDGQPLSYYLRTPTKDIFYYHPDCKDMVTMNRSSLNGKVAVEAMMQHYINGMPDTIGISHKNFNFEIGLKKLER